MKFIIDAQLPRRLVYRLRELQHDATHTLDLPLANSTSDREVLDIAIRDQRIVVTKDSDFVDSLVLSHRPEKLLLISTGNIANGRLEELLLAHFDEIVKAFAESSFVELTQSSLIIHW